MPIGVRYDEISVVDASCLAHFHFHQVADFLDGLSSGDAAAPKFRDGLATDCVTDAVLKSAKTRQWETIPAAQVKVASWSGCWAHGTIERVQ